MTTDLSLIRILTVDDHPLLRKGIAALVNAETDMKLVAEASNGEEAIEKFRSHRPDVAAHEWRLQDFPCIRRPASSTCTASFATRLFAERAF
jgi:DNA-binding NarL/FixJ family response regulator